MRSKIRGDRQVTPAFASRLSSWDTPHPVCSLRAEAASSLYPQLPSQAPSQAPSQSTGGRRMKDSEGKAKASRKSRKEKREPSQGGSAAEHHVASGRSRFESPSGHLPGLRARCPAGGARPSSEPGLPAPGHRRGEERKPQGPGRAEAAFPNPATEAVLFQPCFTGRQICALLYEDRDVARSRVHS